MLSEPAGDAEYAALSEAELRQLAEEAAHSDPARRARIATELMRREGRLRAAPAARDDKVACPRCGSTQIHAEKRGWNLWTGFIGSGSVVLTCLKCSHRFKPGEG
jgi:hypothetical protein